MIFKKKGIFLLFLVIIFLNVYHIEAFKIYNSPSKPVSWIHNPVDDVLMTCEELCNYYNTTVAIDECYGRTTGNQIKQCTLFRAGSCVDYSEDFLVKRWDSYACCCYGSDFGGCTSTNGADPFVKGKTTHKWGTTSEDYCIDSNVIADIKCDSYGQSSYISNLVCPYGCVDGACLREPPLLNEIITCNFKNSNELQKCYTIDNKYECSGINQCIIQVSEYKDQILNWKSSCGENLETKTTGVDKINNYDCTQCTDTDGGKNYYQKGTVTMINDPNFGDNGKKTDFCINEKELMEYICSNGQYVGSINYDCSLEDKICLDGACVQGKKELNLDLSNYPDFFIKDGHFDGFIVVGANALPINILATTNVALGLQSAAITKTIVCEEKGSSSSCYELETINHIPSSVNKLDKDVTSLNQNIISVGNPCDNEISKKIIGSSVCNYMLNKDMNGVIFLKEYNGYIHMIFYGSNDEETLRISQDLLNYKKSPIKGLTYYYYKTDEEKNNELIDNQESLYVNINSVNSIKYNEQFVVSWNSNGDFCYPEGSNILLTGGSSWINLGKLSSKGSFNLIASDVNNNYISSMELGITCFDEKGNQKNAKVVVNVINDVFNDINENVEFFINNTELILFNDCLSEKGFMIYGTNRCPYTNDIINMLGGYGAVSSIYVNCDENNELCISEGIQTYPTIKINNHIYTSIRNLFGFSSETGCYIDENFLNQNINENISNQIINENQKSNSHCFNSIMDEDETDIDCGGSCNPCIFGKRCKIDDDCLSLFCNDGVCDIITEKCNDIYEPVCGINGITYNNKCYANLENVQISYQGECITKIDCLNIYEPVCGINGITYKNKCFAENERINISYYGECRACHDSCIHNGRCYNYGYRMSKQFCSNTGLFINQYKDDSICENNFECISNLCIDGSCISGNIFQKIINWFVRVFG
jgi:hypothetical protein